MQTLLISEFTSKTPVNAEESFIDLQKKSDPQPTKQQSNEDLHGFTLGKFGVQ